MNNIAESFTDWSKQFTGPFKPAKQSDDKRADIKAVDRVVTLGTKCLNPDLFMALEQIAEQIKESVKNRKEP